MNEIKVLHHQGTRVLKTERLTLRPFTAADGPAMYRNWTADAEVTRFLTWPPHSSSEVSAQLAAHWAEEAKEPNCYQWAVVPDALGEPVGSLSVVRMVEHVALAEVGYCIGKAWWGKGIMTEALGAVLDYLIRDVGMNRVEAKHDVNNPASGRVMQKAGMTFEGILRQAARNNTGLCDIAVYAVLAQDWIKK